MSTKTSPAWEVAPLDAASTGAATRQPMIEVDHVTHYFDGKGGRVLAVDDVSLHIPRGQFISVVGPSGCGKTTVLNMVAGLVRPSEGEVRLDGAACRGTSKKVGYMFARDGLFPWRTARRNVELGLELRGVGRNARRQRASELLKTVGLEGFDRSFPNQLSQGMRQRVAVARTLATDPDIFLLDEPFAALDAQTRVLLQNEFLNLWEQLGNTVMFVTHDLTEAIALADRVVVFSARPGRIKLDIEVGIPRPRDVATVRFDEEFNRISEQIWEALRDEVKQ
jgi:NitT/TauT family transport system ATP-binding protein